jgi:penicillin-binding protein 2
MSIDRDNSRYRIFSRRVALLGALQAAGLGALVSRLYFLQVVESDKYATLAEDNRINVRLLAPIRGQITDRLGVPLAINEQNFRALAVREVAGHEGGSLEEVLDHFARLVPLSEADLKRTLRDASRRPSFMPVTVRENLTWDEVSTLELAAPDLPGISIDEGQLRYYPYADAFAHIVGYVGKVSESELDGDPVLALPGFRIGKSGIERFHDQELRGEAGRKRMEVNALGRVIREIDRDPGKPGSEIKLTLDVNLQQFATQRLAQERSAASVVMDAVNGDVYALVSSPSFDPNVFTRGISADTWEDLLSNPASPLTNKAIAGQYAPGSTFKPMVLLAGLESGVIDESFTVFCPGHYDLGDHRFHCWKRGGHGTVGTAESLEHSCDVFYYELSRRVGIDRIAAMARRFGFDSPSGIDLPGERPGTIPDRDWKRANFNKPWTQGETLNAAIGQGYVLATPLQLAVMSARLALGRAVKPHLTLSVDDVPAVRGEFPLMGIKPENLAVVHRGMGLVVNAPIGTAYKARITQKGMEMAGKTGSAQVRRITMAERATGVISNDDLPWNQRDHALFIAFAPLDNPRYACATIVEHGGGGGAVAGPICRDLLLDCQQRDPAGIRSV